MTTETIEPVPDSTELSSSPETKLDDMPLTMRAFRRGLYEELPTNDRLELIKQARNPLLETATPLLTLMTELSSIVNNDSVIELRRLLEAEIKQFVFLCEKLGIAREQIVTAQYCLCTALDELININIVNTADQNGIGPWAQNSLLTTFHKESYGGEKFFLLVGRLAADPEVYLDILELNYSILSLGFEGRYRRDPNGRRQLEAIRSRLLTIINNGRKQLPRDLSPKWRGASKSNINVGKRFPFGLALLLVAALLLLQYGWYRYELLIKSRVIEANILSISKDIPVVARVERLRLKELLADEINKGILTVDESASSSIITFKGDSMFAPARVDLKSSSVAILKRIAAEVQKVNGTITIEGHSDNVPIRSVLYPDNQALSLARANSVGDVFKQEGISTERIVVVGKGDSSPIAPNDTVNGRAQNRRVTITVDESSNTPTVTTNLTPPPVSSAPVR